MKKLATLILVMTLILFLPSCKKDNTTPSNNNNNNNNSNTGNGLGKLAPSSATGYCVLILEGNDTMIWSNTAGNALGGSGGVEGSAGGDMFFAGNGMKNTLTNNWQKAGFSFQMPENHGYTRPSCDYIDSMVKVGNVVLSPSNGNYLWLTYSDGTSVESWFHLNTATCQVVSTTIIPSSTSCYSIRAKIDISNMDMDFNPFCAVYHTHIVKGEMLLDFSVN